MANYALDRLESDHALVVVDAHAETALRRDRAGFNGSAEIHYHARRIQCGDDPEGARTASVRQDNVYSIPDLERCPSETRL